MTLPVSIYCYIFSSAGQSFLDFCPKGTGLANWWWLIGVSPHWIFFQLGTDLLFKQRRPGLQASKNRCHLAPVLSLFRSCCQLFSVPFRNGLRGTLFSSFCFCLYCLRCLLRCLLCHLFLNLVYACLVLLQDAVNI